MFSMKRQFNLRPFKNSMNVAKILKNTINISIVEIGLDFIRTRYICFDVTETTFQYVLNKVNLVIRIIAISQLQISNYIVNYFFLSSEFQ